MDDFDFKIQSNPQTVNLETFNNPETGRRYDIEFTCPEWTALCPMSGFPDFGTIHIKYQPRNQCIELKSLKLYLNSFRHQKIYHEGAVNRILNDLIEASAPWRMEVVGDFNVRGNIKTIIRAAYHAPDYVNNQT
ncbi:MAG: NADPH-dependent 7-cyano-7-deazaguanine reductase QueF [Deltaproteobacteria bacterium]|nr:NADPH-dependent 7-cyano-7-deazaguanine reductase QueF [Deltaproteobacteria bacterium]